MLFARGWFPQFVGCVGNLSDPSRVPNLPEREGATRQSCAERHQNKTFFHQRLVINDSSICARSKQRTFYCYKNDTLLQIIYRICNNSSKLQIVFKNLRRIVFESLNNNCVFTEKKKYNLRNKLTSQKVLLILICNHNYVK